MPSARDDRDDKPPPLPGWYNPDPPRRVAPPRRRPQQSNVEQLAGLVLFGIRLYGLFVVVVLVTLVMLFMLALGSTYPREFIFGLCGLVATFGV